MKSIFTPHTLDEYAQSLASQLPQGRLTQAAHFANSTLIKLLRGFSGNLKDLESVLINFTEQYDPRTTTDFIQQWETMVGIPDECFPGTGDIEERRTHVVAKIMANTLKTEQDYIDMAAFLGFTITIDHLSSSDSLVLPQIVPFIVTPGPFEINYIWIVRGDNIVPNALPQIVPFIVGSEQGTIIQCLFDTVKPAYTTILYQNNP